MHVTFGPYLLGRFLRRELCTNSEESERTDPSTYFPFCQKVVGTEDSLLTTQQERHDTRFCACLHNCVHSFLLIHSFIDSLLPKMVLRLTTFLLLATALPSADAFVPASHTIAATWRQPGAVKTFHPRQSSPVVAQPPQIQVPEFRKPLLLQEDAFTETVEEKTVPTPAPAAGGATVTALCFNLVKSIVGAGVLSLSSGIAVFADAPSAVIPAIAMISSIGALSAYGFALIGRVCAFTDTKSYREAWSATVGPSTSWIPAAAVTFKTFCAILAYSMILGDTFVSLLASMGITAAKVPTLLGLTGGVLLPLCLLKNLSSLAPFSLVGTLGMMYTALAMTIRYVGKSYVAPAGQFVADCAPALRPSFGTIGAEGIFSPSSFLLLGMLSTSYMAHFNAPKVRMK